MHNREYLAFQVRKEVESSIQSGSLYTLIRNCVILFPSLHNEDTFEILASIENGTPLTVTMINNLIEQITQEAETSVKATLN